MQRINQIVLDLLENHTPTDISWKLDVSTAMVSTWKNKTNDFVPRLPVAAKLYHAYGKVVYPYAEQALKEYT